MELSDVANQIHSMNATIVSLQTEMQQLSRLLAKQSERITVLEEQTKVTAQELLLIRGILTGSTLHEHPADVSESDHQRDLQEGLSSI